MCSANVSPNACDQPGVLASVASRSSPLNVIDIGVGQQPGLPIIHWCMACDDDLPTCLRFVGIGINVLLDGIELAASQMAADHPRGFGVPRFAFEMTPDVPGQMRGLYITAHLDVSPDIASEIRHHSGLA